MSKLKQALATLVFFITMVTLRHFLGFETMIMLVIVSWFAASIDK